MCSRHVFESVLLDIVIVQTLDSVKISGIVLDDKRFSPILPNPVPPNPNSPNPEKYIEWMNEWMNDENSCFVEKNRTPYLQ